MVIHLLLFAHFIDLIEDKSLIYLFYILKKFIPQKT